MARELNDGMWQCERCTFTQEKKGWVENHERQKHKMHGGVQDTKKEKKKVRKNGSAKCPDCEGENIRLLNSNNPREKIVLKGGYTKICVDCEEVF